MLSNNVVGFCFHVQDVLSFSFLGFKPLCFGENKKMGCLDRGVGFVLGLQFHLSTSYCIMPCHVKYHIYASRKHAAPLPLGWLPSSRGKCRPGNCSEKNIMKWDWLWYEDGTFLENDVLSNWKLRSFRWNLMKCWSVLSISEQYLGLWLHKTRS